jgi:hypothetical protein
MGFGTGGRIMSAKACLALSVNRVFDHELDRKYPLARQQGRRVNATPYFAIYAADVRSVSG